MLKPAFWSRPVEPLASVKRDGEQQVENWSSRNNGKALTDRLCLKTLWMLLDLSLRISKVLSFFVKHFDVAT